MLALLLLLACAPLAEVVDACDGSRDTAVCRPCTIDAECGLTGNPCLDTVTCAHEDAALAFPDLGCSEALERRWPDEAGCACVDGACAWTE